jgi:hypothetical protein
VLAAHVIEPFGGGEPLAEVVDGGCSLDQRVGGGGNPCGGVVDEIFDAAAFEPEEDPEVGVDARADCGGAIGEVLQLCSQGTFFLHTGRHGAGQE